MKDKETGVTRRKSFLEQSVAILLSASAVVGQNVQLNNF